MINIRKYTSKYIPNRLNYNVTKYIYIYIHILMCIYIYIYICIYTHILVYILCIHISTCICTYLSLSLYIYIYIYIYISRPRSARPGRTPRSAGAKLRQFPKWPIENGPWRFIPLSTFSAQAKPSNPESESPRVKRAKTDPPLWCIYGWPLPTARKKGDGTNGGKIPLYPLRR